MSSFLSTSASRPPAVAAKPPAMLAAGKPTLSCGFPPRRSPFPSLAVVKTPTPTPTSTLMRCAAGPPQETAEKSGRIPVYVVMPIMSSSLSRSASRTPAVAAKPPSILASGKPTLSCGFPPRRSPFPSLAVVKTLTPTPTPTPMRCAAIPPQETAEKSGRIPVYVMMPLDTITMDGRVKDREGLRFMLTELKNEAPIEGVMVDVWWGIVEGSAPQVYNWGAYRELFDMVLACGLKLQVVMSFHRCGGNVGDDVFIPLPQWVLDVGKENPDIFFTDREGRRNEECLSWGVDEVQCLLNRTAVEIYEDYMRSFKQEFVELLDGGFISEVEVGMGPCGELRYPSYPEFSGWIYPGIGQFQCFDKYLVGDLKSVVEERNFQGYGWDVPPADVGKYNDTDYGNLEFFRDGGGFDSLYGRFFLTWYSGILLKHADRILGVARSTFGHTPIAAKVAGIHWYYRTISHAAELTAGFYNPANRDGYAPIASVLKKHGAALNFTCVELRTKNQDPRALSDPEGLVWQVVNAGWDAGIPVACENALPCFGKDGYDKVLKIVKPNPGDPAGRHLCAFTYLRLSPQLLEASNLSLFREFVRDMRI